MFEAYFPKFTFSAKDTDNQRKGDGFGMTVNGVSMMFDSFEGSEASDRLIQWFLNKGITKVDKLLITHWHGDHFNGAVKAVESGKLTFKEVYCIDPLTYKHGVDGSDNGRSVQQDMDNAYKCVRLFQAHGSKVYWKSHGDVVQCGDVSWHIYRKQPTEFTEYDDGNAYAFINDGSLVSYSPELMMMLPGDGPCQQKEAIAYFQKKFGKQDILRLTDVTHHGGSWSLSNAKAFVDAGGQFAFESCIEVNGPGTSDWTPFGTRRLVQLGVTVWMQDEDIYFHAAGGKLTAKQGSKTITMDVPYQGEKVTPGWVHNAKGWWYRCDGAAWAVGWAKIGTNWFFFNADGYMVTGWLWDTDRKCWFYLDPVSGAMWASKWLTYKGKKCWLKESGRAAMSETITIDGKAYYFDSNCYATEITDDAGPLNGVDIASYQAGINPAAMTTTDFVIVKMTQGTDYINPYAEDQYNGAKAAGKLLGAYHYAEGSNAVSEAQYFLKKLRNRVGECIIALDWEGTQNDTFGTGRDVAWCKAWLDEVYKQTGVRGFVYMSKSVTRKYDWSSVAKDYPLWGAQYANNNQTDYQSNPWTDGNAWGAWGSPVIHQYSSHGDIEGYGKNIDIDLAYMGRAQWLAYASGSKIPTTTESSRDRIVALAKSMVGIKEGSAEHHAIIDTYNAYGAAHGYPRGYKVKYTDAWCATFISALAIKCGLESIIPIECGCPQMITIAQSMGEWVENDAYVPQVGDIVLYDWQDSGNGDNTGTPDHVGICTEVSGNALKITEGNYKDAVSVRSLTVNSRYIRGYIVPKY